VQPGKPPKLTDVSVELNTCIIRVITLMTEAVSSSEMTINIYQTIRRNIPEDSHLHTRCREDMKFQLKRKHVLVQQQPRLDLWDTNDDSYNYFILFLWPYSP
jgi:hypothetical protein